MISVASFLRLSDGSFIPFDEVDSYVGDCLYVPGAIVLSVDGVEVLSLELWDDINWLWPFVVQAFDECRRTGRGVNGFPDQPIGIYVEALGSSGQLLISVAGGPVDNKAVGPADEIYEAVAQAALAFFAKLHRLCTPLGPADDEIIKAVESWLAADRQ